MCGRWIFYLLGGALLLTSCSPESELEGTGLENLQSGIEGAYEEENRWVYTQMNRNYYWREDMPDSVSCDYTTDPVTFFESLLSPGDRFSYCERNKNYSGAPRIRDYGFEFSTYSDGADSYLNVLYVYSETVKKEGLCRGDWLRETDIEGMYEKGYFTSTAFCVTDTLSVESLPGDVDRSSVYMDSIYVIGERKIGYLVYLEYDGVADLEPVMKRFYDEKIDELILDLRYNPGGYVSTCKYLCNSIIPELGYDSIFQQCTYNSILSKEYLDLYGDSIKREYYKHPTNDSPDILGSRLYGLNLQRLCVLTSRYTASASEATIICCRPFMDVVVIGEQTLGKGVGSWPISNSKCKYVIQPITMRYHNMLMETTPDVGIKPVIEIADGYNTSKRELGDLKEPLLAEAIAYICGKRTDSSTTSQVSAMLPAQISQVGNPSFVDKSKFKYE